MNSKEKAQENLKLVYIRNIKKNEIKKVSTMFWGKTEDYLN